MEILEPKIKRLLADLESLKLIKISENGPDLKANRRFGSMKGLVEHVADDFDAPLEDFENHT